MYQFRLNKWNVEIGRKKAKIHVHVSEIKSMIKSKFKDVLSLVFAAYTHIQVLHIELHRVALELVERI